MLQGIAMRMLSVRVIMGLLLLMVMLVEVAMGETTGALGNLGRLLRKFKKGWALQ